MRHPINTILGVRIPGRLLRWAPAVFVLFIGTGAAFWHNGTTRAGRGELFLAAVLVAGVILARHRYPRGTLLTLAALTLLISYSAISTIPLLLAVFTVAEYCRRPDVSAGAVLAGVVLLVSPILHGANINSSPQIISRLVAVGLAVALGLYLRARADYVTGLQDRAARLERERELLAEQAVADERLRIARELHDVVAHNVSLMVVQSQAVAVTTDDASQRAALNKIGELGREAMGEMHRMLGVLRRSPADADGEPVEPDREPQPGLGDLMTLVARAREAGLETELVTGTLPATLPPAVELSAFRIVQEALTNVIRHAQAQRATVRVTAHDGRLEIEIDDDGVSQAAGAPGHGILGMHERVALFGGRLEAGPRTSAPGFRVHASLPVT